MRASVTAVRLVVVVIYRNLVVLSVRCVGNLDTTLIGVPDLSQGLGSR